MDGCITKPIEAVDLFKTIDEVLTAAESQLHFHSLKAASCKLVGLLVGDISVNPLNEVFDIGGVGVAAIVLTPGELAVE